jgi:hypothetical protein
MHDILHYAEDIFSTASLDLIHLHFLTGVVPLQQFLSCIQSITQICNSGGLLVWTEAELPITTSLACQRLCSLVWQGLQAKGHVLSHGNSMGITARMSIWLHEAGWQITLSKAYAIDISIGSKGNEAFVTQKCMASEQIRTFLLGIGITTAPEFEHIFSDMQQEIQDQQFCGLLYRRTLVGMRL